MFEDPACPVCARRVWRVLGVRKYQRPHAGSAGGPAGQPWSAYVHRRLEVLFTAWFPGRTEVEITSILCESCGLVAYRPRPEPADVDAKYRLLTTLSASDPPAPEPPVAVRRARERGLELAAAVTALAGRAITGLDVLDYGGGNGGLMQPFLEAGCGIDLVDYIDQPWPGVRHAGYTLADLPQARAYDLIVASHVIEHLADPLGTVRQLAGHLVPAGLLYAEVPMEIWGRPPLQREPLTHINFFTVASLRHLLESAGLRVRACRLASSRHPSGRRFAAVKAVAVRDTDGPDPAPPVPPGPAEAERFLSSHPVQRLQCALRCPRVLVSALLQRVLGRDR